MTAQVFGQAVSDLFVPTLFDQGCRGADVLDVDHGRRLQFQPVNDRLAVGRADGCKGVSVDVRGLGPL